VIHLITTVEEARIHWLPQFISHYQELGVDDFHVSLHFEAGTPTPRMAENTARAQAFLETCRIALSSVLICAYDAMQTRAHHDRIQAQLSRDDWVIWADVDEFQVWPDEMKSLVRHASAHDQEYFRGEIIDRISEDGTLRKFDPDESIFTQFPKRCYLTRDIANAPTRKVACSRALIKITPGNHYAVNDSLLKHHESVIEVHHFKWDASVLTRLRRRLEPDWRERCPWWTESKKLVDQIEQWGGRVLPPEKR
jgi:hypothetical protein